MVSSEMTFHYNIAIHLHNNIICKRLFCGAAGALIYMQLVRFRHHGDVKFYYKSCGGSGQNHDSTPTAHWKDFVAKMIHSLFAAPSLL